MNIRRLLIIVFVLLLLLSATVLAGNYSDLIRTPFRHDRTSEGAFGETIPDPWEVYPPQEGQYIVPASRFYATGGTAPDYEYKGVDGYSLITIPRLPLKWEETYRIDLYHTGDWVVYHIPARNAILEVIEIAGKNPYTPSVGTPVQVYVKEGPALPPLHDADLDGAGWHYVGEYTILPPGNWKVYSFATTNVTQSDSYSVGIRLREGEIGPENPTTPFREDRNVYLAWIKIYA